MKAMTWEKEESRTSSAEGGITWIELYAIYTVHGGGKEDRRQQEEDPLKKTQMLQPKIAELKNVVRKIKKHAVKTEDEWMLDTCHAPKTD